MEKEWGGRGGGRTKEKETRMMCTISECDPKYAALLITKHKIPFIIPVKCILETYLIPGTLGTSQHDLGLPSEDAVNCFLPGSMSPNPIPNNCPSVTETQTKKFINMRKHYRI